MHRVLIVSVLCLALATQAMAQTPYDFTVKPEYIPPKTKMMFKPRLTHAQPERFEPSGSREGNKVISMSVSRFYDRGRTEVTMKLFGELNNTSQESVYRNVLSPKKERLITFGVSHTFE